MFAARLTDMIVSTATSGIPAPIAPLAPTGVLIGGLPALRQGDSCGTDAILKGSLTVKIGGLGAARSGDPSVGGGIISTPGQLNVMIGG